MYVVVDEENENIIIIKLVEKNVEWWLICVKDVVIVVKFDDYFVVKMFVC